jgi:SAM-dependent methyltransferase
MSPSARSKRFAKLRRATALGTERPGAPAPRKLSRNFGPTELALDDSSITRLFYDRLSEDDVEDVIRQAATELAECPPIGNDPATRRWLALNYGVWLNVPAVLDKTGLSAAQPPEGIHAMARGPMAAAGGLGESDLVIDALRSAGVAPERAGAALDFGCSSGRVVRVLAAAFPEVRWRGCDPNAPAIEWAREHLATIEFFLSPQEPPLPIPDGELGFAYAISIWSHFAPQLGLRWFAEMHRVIRPGGHLVFTTHGMHSVAFAAASGARSPQQCEQILDALYRNGHWYRAEFGERGDEGVVNPDWGTSFQSAEWLLAKLSPRWRVLEFAPGRNQRNQDVYVLERV